MAVDAINEEIRQVRRALAARFSNDVEGIVADLKQRQAASARTYISFRREAPKTEQVNPAPVSDSEQTKDEPTAAAG